MRVLERLHRIAPGGSGWAKPMTVFGSRATSRAVTASSPCTRFASP
jgi:hypothetical protein